MPGAVRTSAPAWTGIATAARSVATTGAAIRPATRTPTHRSGDAACAAWNRNTSPAIAPAASARFQPPAAARPLPRRGRSRASTPAGRSNRSTAIQASRHAAIAVPVSSAIPGAAEAGPVAAGDERGSVRRENRCGERVEQRQRRRRDGVRRPAPAAAVLESDDEEQRRESDPEDAERVGSRLAGRVDDARVDRQSDAGNQASDAAEHHPAEDDHEPRGEGNRDRRRHTQRQLVGSSERGQLEREQVTRLPRCIVHDRRDQITDRGVGTRERRRFVARERPVAERDNAEQQRAERDRKGCEAPCDVPTGSLAGGARTDSALGHDMRLHGAAPQVGGRPTGRVTPWPTR